MIYVKSESKRKNVMTSLVATLLVVGGIMLEGSLSQKEQLGDCSCPEQRIQVQQQEAGWFWGRHKTKNGCVKRRFGISFGSCDVECATYE